MASIWEMLQNAARGTYNGMSQAGEDMANGIVDAATLPRDVYQGKVDLDPTHGSVRDMSGQDFGRVMNMAGNVAGGGITTGSAPEGALGMFIGRNAKTFPQGELLTEGVGEAMGHSPQQIYANSGGYGNTTGIFRGVDGLPRVEISDKGITPDFSRLREGQMTPLGQMLDHPELYRAYPELKDLKVTADPRDSYYASPRTQEAMDRGGEFISLARDGRTHEDMRGTLLHEIQHWVQNREGFASGYSQNGHEIVNSDVIQGMQRKLEEMRLQYMRDSGRLQDLGPRGVDVGAMNTNIDNYNALANQIPHAKFGAYARAAGEVEARTTQQRRDLSLPERQAEMPTDWAGRDTYTGPLRLSHPPEHQWIPGKTTPFPDALFR